MTENDAAVWEHLATEVPLKIHMTVIIVRHMLPHKDIQSTDQRARAEGGL